MVSQALLACCARQLRWRHALKLFHVLEALPIELLGCSAL